MNDNKRSLFTYLSYLKAANQHPAGRRADLSVFAALYYLILLGILILGVIELFVLGIPAAVDYCSDVYHYERAVDYASDAQYEAACIEINKMHSFQYRDTIPLLSYCEARLDCEAGNYLDAWFFARLIEFRYLPEEWDEELDRFTDEMYILAF